MDKEYIVTITEVLQRKIHVRASDKEEAKYTQIASVSWTPA